MGKACDKMKEITSDIWHAFSPRRLDLPECVREVLEFVYPTIDWDRVTFYIGYPHLLKAGGKSAMTLPSTYSLNHIDIYLNPDEWGMCSCHQIGLFFVHEGFHVLQITDLIGGWGLGMARPITAIYLTCWARNGFKYDGHALEIPAYRVAGCDNSPGCQDKWGTTTSLFEGCCAAVTAAPPAGAGNPLPCDCGADPRHPTLNVNGLNALKAGCPDLVQTSSGLNFWEQMADCIPGLDAIKKAADDVYAKTCKSDSDESVHVDTDTPHGPGPGPTDPDSPAPRGSDTDRGGGGGITIPLKYILCFFGLLIAGFLYLIYGLYFGLWLIASIAATFLLWFVRIFVEIIGLFVTGILGLATIIVCIAEWFWNGLKAIWNTIRDLLHKACDWADNTRKRCDHWEKTTIETCSKWADEGSQECSKWADEGYQDCAEWADEGSNQCSKKIKKCKWTSPWNCVAKWICKAWHWVAKMVCKGWYWVTNMVCKGWFWLAKMVCKGWVKTISWGCKGFTGAVKAATCW